MKRYHETVQEVQELLKANPEWESRYAKYMVDLASLINANAVCEAQKKFSVPTPFQLYLPLSMAVHDCSEMLIVFDLRFHGQSVASIYVDTQKDASVMLHIKEKKTVYAALHAVEKNADAEALKKLADALNGVAAYDWHSEEAKDFRRIYAELEVALTQNNLRLTGQPEHDMESWLLKNYAQTSSAQKEVSYIQPVTMLGSRAFFQMPTPIKASNVKKGVDQLAYSRQYGGGIDILARVGSGRSTTLAVLELKDENKASEVPEYVLCQAVAYATFIQALLRSNCGQQWWEFFGFGGTIPKALKLKAAVVMPYRSNKGVLEQHTQEFMDSIQRENIIQFPDTDDRIELGYIFRDAAGSDEAKIIKFF